MSSEGDYLIGETKHLIYCGMTPEQICTTLNRTPSAIVHLATRRGETEIAKLFNQLKTQQTKG